MNKLKLEISDLEVHSFTATEYPEPDAAVVGPMASEISCNGWCTLLGRCYTFFICDLEPYGAER